MKRIAIYVVVLALLTLAPVEGADLGKMHPVEAVLVYQQADQTVIATDTGDLGKGADGVSALEDLKATADGIVYLDTAEYLLIGGGGEPVAEQLRPHLKKSIKVCMTEETVDLKGVVAYLSVHRDLTCLKDWNSGDNLPKLQVVDERFLLSSTKVK